MRLFTHNGAKYRLLRTIIQGVIGVIIANLDTIIAHVDILPMWARAIVAALVMAVLSPIMAMLGSDAEPDKGELPYNYWEEGEDNGEGE
jgi:multisubunit Na+/H+ antiporter MnhG subunit